MNFGYRLALSKDANEALIMARFHDQNGPTNNELVYSLCLFAPDCPLERCAVLSAPLPCEPTLAPTMSPTSAPTMSPTSAPTNSPTLWPTSVPTASSNPSTSLEAESTVLATVIILAVLGTLSVFFVLLGIRRRRRQSDDGQQTPRLEWITPSLAISSRSNGARSRSASSGGVRSRSTSRSQLRRRSLSRRRDDSVSGSSRSRSASSGSRSRQRSLSRVPEEKQALSNVYTPAPAPPLYTSAPSPSERATDSPAYSRSPGGVGVYGSAPGHRDDKTVSNRLPFKGGYMSVISKPPPPPTNFRHVISAQELHKQQVLGAGNFGRVWLADWNGTPVALKEVTSGPDRASKDQLVLEAQRLQMLPPHPNVVQFFGVVTEPSLAVLLEYCPGGSLDEALYGEKKRAFGRDKLVSIARGVIQGVAHLHRHNIVHRDLAARNVLLDAADVPKVTDFGMSREQTGYNQMTQTVVGPIKWMAPEQMSNQAVSKRADIWALGVVLFEVFAQQPPWQGKRNVEVAHAVMGGSSLLPPEAAPTQVKEAMMRCFERDPKQRPSAMELGQLLATSPVYGNVGDAAMMQRYGKFSISLNQPPGYQQHPAKPLLE